MSSPLPDFLDPWRAANSRSVFAGRLPLSSLPRLRGMLLDAAGDVTFRLAFFRAEDRRVLLRCRVAATLTLSCQRCLEALDHRVGVSVLLAPVSGIDEERRLAASFDPLVVQDKLLRPRNLIEDELLLALPQIPMHEPDVCRVETPEVRGARARPGIPGPFSGLAVLKRGS